MRWNKSAVGILGAVALVFLLFYAPWEVRHPLNQGYMVRRATRAPVFSSNPGVTPSEAYQGWYAGLLTNELALEVVIVLSITVLLLFVVPRSTKPPS
jgi:hypothetical protein